MDDYDVWIKELLDETTSFGGDLNTLVRRIYQEAFEHAKETMRTPSLPERKPKISEEEAYIVLQRFFCFEPERYREAIISDMNAQAKTLLPAIRTLAAKGDANSPPPHIGARSDVGGRIPKDETQKMHPDLKYLAGCSPERLARAVQGLSPQNKVVLYRERYEDGDRLCAAIRGFESSDQVFTLDEVKKARYEYLEKKAEAFQQKDPYAVDVRDRMMHDLINLPDYETWFETHGDERTVKHMVHPLREATVHELYAMFRARLLDELHQAGVVGDDHG